MSCGVNFYLSVGLQFGHGKKTSRNERTLVKTCWRGFRRSLRTSPASLTYLVMTSFDSISGNVSTLEVKTNTHGQPSGARACGKRRHPAWWVGEGSPRETLSPTLRQLWQWHKDDWGQPVPLQWLGRVLHEWVFAVPCLQVGVSSGFSVPPCAALQSPSGAELGLLHLVDPMGNV